MASVLCLFVSHSWRIRLENRSDDKGKGFCSVFNLTLERNWYSMLIIHRTICTYSSIHQPSITHHRSYSFPPWHDVDLLGKLIGTSVVIHSSRFGFCRVLSPSTLSLALGQQLMEQDRTHSRGCSLVTGQSTHSTFDDGVICHLETWSCLSQDFVIDPVLPQVSISLLYMCHMWAQSIHFM